MSTPPPIFSLIAPAAKIEARPPVISTSLLEEVLITAAFLPAAFAGTMFRHLVGAYYKIFDTEINYCILYANIVGCVIMGFVVQHSVALKASPRRTYRILYTALTTGMCGSITTFSTWMFECNKNFLLQWEGPRSMSAANGGRLFEYLITLWVGVATPLMAYRLGTHLAALSPHADARVGDAVTPINGDGQQRSGEDSSCWCRKEAWGTAVLLSGAVASTALVIVLPVVLYPTFTYLTYTAVLGFAGAYVRWKLALALNSTFPRFPLGTFLANTLGTWLLAVLVLLSKFVVGYYNTTLQGLLYAAIVGFCGCLTTVSTFVHELDGMPVGASYAYGLGTTAAAQVGLILIYNVFAFLRVPQSALVAPVPVNACVATHRLCNELMDAIRCPAASRVAALCDATAPFTNVSACRCGGRSAGGTGFATDIIPLLLTSALVRPDFTNTFVYAWPIDATAVADPFAVFDYCLTFERVCTNALDRIGCPASLRVSNGCNRQGILSAASACACGGWAATGNHLPTLLVGAALTARPAGALAAALVPPACAAYQRLCARALDLVNCPRDAATAAAGGCGGNSTLAHAGGRWPTCKCGPSLDLTTPVRDTLLTALARPSAPLHLAADATGYCAGFARTCAAVLAALGCPAAALHTQVCGVAVTGPPGAAAAAAALGNASAAHGNTSSVSCACLGPPRGFLYSVVPAVPGALVTALVVSSLLDATLTANFSVAPPPFSSPYVAMVRSNPFTQLIV